MCPIFVLSCIILVTRFTEGASVGNAATHQFTKEFSSSPPYVAHFKTDANTVNIRLEVKTHGYVGFGFSPDGTMNNAELIIGGAGDDGKPYFGIYHALGHTPRRFESHDWVLTSAVQNETSTTLEIVRPVTAAGHEIHEGEISVIWSIGADDDTANHHILRGATKITLLPNDGENVVDIHGRDADESSLDTSTRNQSGKKKDKQSQNSTATPCVPCYDEDDETDQQHWWLRNSSSVSSMNLGLICISLSVAIFSKF